MERKNKTTKQIIDASNLTIKTMALNLAGLSVNDQTTDLILKTFELLEERGQELSVKDMAKLKVAWEDKWNNKEEK